MNVSGLQPKGSQLNMKTFYWLSIISVYEIATRNQVMKVVTKINSILVI